MICSCPRMPSSWAGVTAGEGCTVASIILQADGVGTSPRQAQYSGRSGQQILTMMHELWEVTIRTCNDFFFKLCFFLWFNCQRPKAINILVSTLTFTARNPLIAVPVFKTSNCQTITYKPYLYSLKTTNLQIHTSKKHSCPLWSAKASSITELHC